jgi:hypothetical protein
MATITTLGEKGSDPFPTYKNLWSMYSKKGLRTIFVSIGSSKSCLADLEIAEAIGCPIHIVPLSTEGKAAWEEVKEILKTHERPVDAVYDFSKGSDDKWVLPKNMHIHESLPWWTKSVMELNDGFSVPTVPMFDWVTQVCVKSKLVDDTRIDILKVDVSNGLECSILGAMLNAGLRPGCIFVNWEEMPDTHTPTTLAAGHLQSCGYKLVEKIDKKFFYHFIDHDIYMTCSWEDTRSPNPMVHEIISSYEASRSKVRMPTTNTTNKSFTTSTNTVV